MMLTLWSCQYAGTFTRRWCAQGRTESNCHSAGFGDQPPNRWVIPMQRPKMRSLNRTRVECIAKTKNRPLGLPRRTVPGIFPGEGYPETTPRG
jgi:hypothetical protein